MKILFIIIILIFENTCECLSAIAQDTSRQNAPMESRLKRKIVFKDSIVEIFVVQDVGKSSTYFTYQNKTALLYSCDDTNYCYDLGSICMFDGTNYNKELHYIKKGKYFLIASGYPSGIAFYKELSYDIFISSYDSLRFYTGFGTKVPMCIFLYAKLDMIITTDIDFSSDKRGHLCKIEAMNIKTGKKILKKKWVTPEEEENYEFDGRATKHDEEVAKRAIKILFP